MKVKVFVLILMLSFSNCNRNSDHAIQVNDKHFIYESGAITRADTTLKNLSLVFTGHEFADGSEHILSLLKEYEIQGSFFLTGDFYRNNLFSSFIKTAINEGHYLGAHSDKHLLYCSWGNRDSLLVSEYVFKSDLRANYEEMQKFGVLPENSPYFLPPFEWYNDSITYWTKEMDLNLINFTSGTRSNADYTTPDMKNYISSSDILDSIKFFEKESSSGLNGFLLLIHLGVEPTRTDKFYLYLEDLITYLVSLEYDIIPLQTLLEN